MPETEIFRGKIEYEDNADQAAQRIDGLRGSTLQASRDIDEGARTIGDRVRGIGAQFEALDSKSKRVLSGTLVAGMREYASGVYEAVQGTTRFRTTVSDASSATALMFEVPARSLREFVSIARVGMAEVRAEGGNLALGVRTIARAAADASQEVFGFEAGAKVLNKIANTADLFSGFLGKISGRAKAADGDLASMLRTISNMGNALRVQTFAWQQTFSAQGQAKKAELDQAQAVLQTLEKGTDAYAEQQAAVRALSQEYRQMQGLQGVQGKQVDLIRNSMLTLNNSLRRLQTNYQATGVWSKQYAERAKLDIGSIEREMRRLEKMGGVVPDALRKNYESIIETFEVMEQRALRLGQETEKSNKRIRGSTKETQQDIEESGQRMSRSARQMGDATDQVRRGFLGIRRTSVDASVSMNRYSSSMSNVLQQNQSLVQYVSPQGMMTTGLQNLATNATKTGAAVQQVSLSFGSLVGIGGMIGGTLGELDPAFSAVIVGASQMADQFGRSMSAMMSVGGTAAQKIKAAMDIVSSSLLAFGAMALGTIVKTGMLAAEVKTAEITLTTVARNLAREAGADVEKFSNYVMRLRDDLVETGITTREATNAFGQFLRARLPVEKIKDLANAAKNLGVTVANMSSSEVLGRFVQFIQTGNSALLDAIGIAKNASVMMEEYAKTIGKTAKTLSTREKQEALIQGLMNETVTVAGVYDEAMKTTGKQLSSMKRYFEEAILVLGQRFEPMLAQVVMGANKVLKAFTELSPKIHDNIAAVIKWVGTYGIALGVVLKLAPALKALVPIIRSVSSALLKATPQVALLLAAIGAVIAIVKGFKKLWDENFGGIQQSIAGLVAAIKQGFGPIIQDIRYWFGIFGQEIRQIVGIVTENVKIVVAFLTEVAGNVQSKLGGAFVTLRDIVNGVMRAVSHFLVGIQSLLRGDVSSAWTFFESAAINVLTSIALFFKNFVARAATWGWNLVAQLANGITRAASTILAKVMNWLGGIIGRFIRPGSPPKEGPLKHIAEWGRGVMETYLRSFALADFSLLKDIMAPIQQALEDAVAAENLKEVDLVPTIQAVRGDVARLLSTFRETGQVNEEIIDGISSRLGEGGKDITEYIRRLMSHQKALRELQSAQEDYAKYEAAGFVPAEAKARLKAAEEQAKSTEEAVSWQQEFIAAQKDTVDLQLKQLELLKRMADAMEKAAGAMTDAAEGLGGEAELALDIPDMPETEGIFDKDTLGGIKLGLGEVSEEFLAMKERITDIVQGIKDWIALPLDEKIQTIKDTLSDLLDKAVTWLEDITGWDVSTWVDNFKLAVEKAWNWIVEKAQWLYDTLIGRSIIPDLVDGIVDWFSKIPNPFEWIKNAIADVRNFFVGIIDFFIQVFRAIKATGVLAIFAGIIAAVVKAKAIILVVGAIFGKIAGGVAAAWQVVQGLFVLVGGAIQSILAPVLGIAAAIAALIYGIWSNRDQLLGFWEDFKESVADIWDRLKPALEDFWRIAKPILTAIGAIVGGVIGVAVVTLISAFQALWDTVKAILPQIKGLFSGVFDVIYGVIKAVLLPIVDLFVGLFNLITGNSEEAKASFVAAWEGLKEGLGLIFQGIFKIVSNALGGVLNFIISFAGNLLRRIGEWAKKILEKFGLGGLADSISVVIGKIGDILKMIQTAIAAFVNWIVERAKWLYDKLIGHSILTDLIDGIIKVFGRIWQVVTTIKDVVKQIIGFFSRLARGVIEFLQPAFAFFGQIGETFGFLKGATSFSDFIERLKTAIPQLVAGLVNMALALRERFINLFVNLVQIAREKLPLVLAALREWAGKVALWFTTVLAPKIAEVAGVAWDKLVLIAKAVWEYLKANVPVWVSNLAAALAEWFTTTLVPTVKAKWEEVSVAVADWFTNTFIPAVKAKWEELKVVVADWFTNTFVPAVKAKWEEVRTTVADWFTNTFIPGIKAKWEELKETISTWFTETFIPGLKEKWEEVKEGIYSWFVETFLPWFEALWDEIRLKVNYWFTEVFIPALKEKWEEVKTAIANWFTETFIPAIEGLWEDVKTAITDKWSEIKTSIGDKLAEIVVSVTDLAADLIAAGKGILDNIWQGIKDGWENFKQNIVDKFNEFKEMLPFSEPKNPASPFYGLGKAGAAIIKNIADGMTGVDLSSQFAVQMAGMVDGLAAAPVYNRNMQNSYNFHPGSLVFPNVTDRTRGESFGQQFRRAMSEADLRRRG